MGNGAGIVHKIKRAYSLITIETSILIHLTASFLGNLTISNLSLYKACTVDLKYNVTFCEAQVNRPRGPRGDPSEEEINVQEILAEIRTWTSVIDNIFPIIFILFIGAWSDRYGRKLPYLISIFGYVMRYTLLILATYFTSWDATTTQLLSVLPVALTGSRTALSVIIYSYVADTTNLEDRTLKMGTAIAMRTFGRFIGQIIGGEMNDADLGYYVIFGTAIAIDLLALLQAAIFLKDTADHKLIKDDRGWDKFKAVFHLGSLKDTAKSFVKKRPRNNRTRLYLLVVIVVCAQIPLQAEESQFYEFTRIQLGWNAGDYGVYGAFRAILALIAGIASVGILSKWMKLSDPFIGFLSTVSQITAAFVYCFATSDFMIYLAPIVDILNGTIIMAARSMVSKIIPKIETGKVNSFIGVIETVAPLPVDPAYSALYRITLASLPGAFFLLSGAVTIPALIIFVIFTWFWYREDEDPNLLHSDISDDSYESANKVSVPQNHDDEASRKAIPE